MAWGAAAAAAAATLGLLRGVRPACMGRMPDIGCGWLWPALGLCRGAIEVSVVGMGSVILKQGRRNVRCNVYIHFYKKTKSFGLFHLALVWLFLSTASLALIGSGSFAGMDEFWMDKMKLNDKICVKSLHFKKRKDKKDMQ